MFAKMDDPDSDDLNADGAVGKGTGTVADAMAALLKHGPCTPAALASAIGCKPDSVRRNIARHPGRFAVTRDGQICLVPAPAKDVMEEMVDVDSGADPEAVWAEAGAR